MTDDIEAKTEKHREQLRQQEKAKRNAGRYTLEEAANELEKHTGESAEIILPLLAKSAKTGDLAVYLPGSNVPISYGENNHPTRVREFYEEAYWNDLNKWLIKTLPKLDWEFPAPAPMVQTSTDTATPDDDWEDKARTIADNIALERYNRGEREISARNISCAVQLELAKDSTAHGNRGERSADGIRSKALKG